MYREPDMISSLQDHLLVSTSSLNSTFFEETVIYVCNHSAENGAMGLVINKPLEGVSFKQIIDDMGLARGLMGDEGPIIFNGGPVEKNRGFVLHSPDYSHPSTIRITDEICLSATADIVSAIASGHGPEDAHFSLGYAGWAPGQLEKEIADNSWMIVPADRELLFDIPTYERYDASLGSFGITSMNFVDSAVGYA